MTGFMELLLQPSQVSTAKVSSGWEMQEGQMPAQLLDIDAVLMIREPVKKKKCGKCPGPDSPPPPQHD